MLINKLVNSGEARLQEKTVTPSVADVIVTPDYGYDALNKVTINAVTNTIDANIISANIKKDVTILGVQGNLNPYLYTFHITDYSFIPSNDTHISNVHYERNIITFDVNCVEDENFSIKIYYKNGSQVPVSVNLVTDMLASVGLSVYLSSQRLEPDETGYAKINFYPLHNVTGTISVNIETSNQSPFVLQQKIASGVGEVTADSGYNGLEKVVLSNGTQDYRVLQLIRASDTKEGQILSLSSIETSITEI